MNKQRRGDYTGTPNTNKVPPKIPMGCADPNKGTQPSKTYK